MVPSLIVTTSELERLNEGRVVIARLTPLPDGTFELEFEDESELEDVKEILGR